MVSENLSLERVAAHHAEGLARLFERADCPCYCQYWSFGGDHREWQIRCATDRPQNRADLFADLEAERIHGVVARQAESILGYVRVDRPSVLKKTYEGRLYRGLPCFSGNRESVWAVACFLVDPEERRQGIARQLLEAAIELARAQGAETLEAFPRGATDVSDGEQWTGPLPLYEKLGFQRIHDFAPYPVYRLDCRSI